jgi:hypothetical protein
MRNPRAQRQGKKRKASIRPPWWRRGSSRLSVCLNAVLSPVNPKPVFLRHYSEKAQQRYRGICRKFHEPYQFATDPV